MMEICRKDLRFFEINTCKYVDGTDFWIYRPSSLNNPIDNSVMFITKEYLSFSNRLNNVKNCLIFWPVGYEIPKDIAKKNAVKIVDDPHNYYCLFYKQNKINNLPKKEEYNIIDNSFICKDAIIGKDCIIMPGSYISGKAIIGDNVFIGSGTKIIGEVYIGNNVIIRENTVIGADGLSTDRDSNGDALTMPQFGYVVIEDNVQIGANTTIARGAIDSTHIGFGSKIDNNCFISHNVQIGRSSFIVGETIMFGSSKLGDYSMVSGNSTIRNGIKIGDKSLVGMGSVVTKNVSNDSIVKGNPAK